MYLKSLTLKGFKSFADSTSLELEPGVTVVVGPNGSGKSNVVDAIAWVLGAQGPRVVRSAKMDDVIFAGTDRRAALGRAEVALTIDNSARRLPIEFNEVTITRTLFRSGESEYALNGVACRLLDIQELLSDSGVGRQQHVIIGQGQLDVVLAQRPEDRRAVIEEAAGVLKFRRRRERAERRLESSETALARLTDLHREVRRQIRPLERQAASAVRHAQLEAELRALRLYLAGQELTALERRSSELSTESRDSEVRARTLTVELATLETGLVEAEDRLAASRAEGLVVLLGRAERLGERAAGIAALHHERRRARDEILALVDGGESLEATDLELARTITELDRLDGALELGEVAARELRDREAELHLAEQDHAERFGPLDSEAPVELARVRNEHGEARAEQSRATAAAARTAEHLAGLERELAEATEQLEVVQGAHRAAEVVVAEAEQAAGRALTTRTSASVEAETSAAVLEELRERHSAARARLEALEQALDEARARAGLERVGDAPGVLGTVLDLLNPSDELLAALSAAIESVLDAIVLADADRAAEALRRLRSSEGTGAVVALTPVSSRAPRSAAPAGSSWLAEEFAAAPAPARAFADSVLGGVVLCRGGFEAALTVARAHPELVVVTPDGDRFAPGAWRVGLRSHNASPALLARQRDELDANATALETARAVASAAESEREVARERLAAAESERLAARVDLARLAAELEQRGAALTKLRSEHERASAAAVDAANRLASLSGSLAEVEGRLFALEEIGQAHLERSNERLEAARELEQRRSALAAARHEHELERASLDQRRQLLGQRELELRALAERRRTEIATAQATAADERAGAGLAEVGTRLEALRAHLEELRARLALARDRRAATLTAIGAELEELRARRRGLESSIDAGRARRQQLEIEATEVRVRRESALEALARELGATVEVARSAQLPEIGEGVEPADRAASLEAELVTLGPVNPLAREELAELEERSGFLESQLEDVRGARRELHQVIRAVDAEIVEIFNAAFADVAAHFSNLFELLFPGGSGRLVLTDPDEPLSTGVEIEARPAGRNVRRLSLLSGGERSLTALAFLFAVFRSRPSPFYVLDEVEAALDEVNLRRFLGLLEEFRDEAQLIVVSHQKKTMETADALYGVTMQAGGASKVVSERVARAELGRELSSP